MKREGEDNREVEMTVTHALKTAPRLKRWVFTLIVGAIVASTPGALFALDPNVNQAGAAGNTGRDPGSNQSGAAGNVGAGRDPGNNQAGAAGNAGGAAPRRDPRANQRGARGNRGGRRGRR